MDIFLMYWLFGVFYVLRFLDRNDQVMNVWYGVAILGLLWPALFYCHMRQLLYEARELERQAKTD